MDLEPGLTATYLARLGFDTAPPPTLASLRSLHRAHLRRIPFENLDIHLGVPIVLDAEAFARKIAERSRGGFCYELNGAFAALLATIGYRVELLAAAVYGPDGLSGRFSHLCLAVHVDGDLLLADVGFGRGGFDEPIRLEAGVLQTDTAGEFVLRAAGEGTLDLLRDGAAEYRFSRVPRRLGDFLDGCTFHQTSPESVFTRSTTCSIRTPDGRTTVSGTRLIETAGDARSERDLDAAGLAVALRDRFGIDLERAAVDRLARA